MIIKEEIETLEKSKSFKDDSLYRYMHLINNQNQGVVNEKIVEKIVKDLNVNIEYKNDYGDTALFEV